MSIVKKTPPFRGGAWVSGFFLEPDERRWSFLIPPVDGHFVVDNDSVQIVVEGKNVIGLTEAASSSIGINGCALAFGIFQNEACECVSVTLGNDFLSHDSKDLGVQRMTIGTEPGNADSSFIGRRGKD